MPRTPRSNGSLIANDVAKYFAIIPALFVATYPQLEALNVMGLHSPQSAILSAVIFNALIIIALFEQKIATGSTLTQNDLVAMLERADRPVAGCAAWRPICRLPFTVLWVSDGAGDRAVGVPRHRLKRAHSNYPHLCGSSGPGHALR
jgi:hypothetical protein